MTLGDDSGGGAVRFKRPRAIVVDDQPQLRELFAETIKPEGFAVLVAGCYADGIAALDEQTVLLVTDLEMPGRSGVELIAEVRARRLDVGIIAVTANALALGAASRAGADAVLVKPFSLEDLRLAVRRLIERPATRAASAVSRGGARAESRAHGGRGPIVAVR